MSRINIDRYYDEVDKIIRFGGSRNETAIRAAFFKLLNSYCETKDFMLIPELDYKTKLNTTVHPDGTVKDALRLDWGYWESKDTKDDLNVEIKKKIEKGYPDNNIIYEDSNTAILIQAGEEILKISVKDEENLHRLLTTFINYERPEVKNFRDAIEKFKEDLPTILVTLRNMISKQAETNKIFQKTRDQFLVLCKEVINPAINHDDIREMMIQHILTDEIFTHVYGESHFHKENNIAHELQLVVDTFFIGQVRKDLLSSIESYYKVIKHEASHITNHKEKQKFLKVIYENFYKVYNPKGADRLGIFYTPDEIVNFMIESTDFLLNKHFGKLMSDNNVEILDPATGTGTFIADIIDYIPLNKLEYKYDNEIHANEVAILPYYIANLNIEYTFKQKTGKYKEFQNICFVDTLDNFGFKMEFGHKPSKNLSLFGGLSIENLERIERQNKKEITVIIGNPPYNANQKNFNDFNKNREYPEIDERIKMTFVKESKAQKTKYDMYLRFYRWAMDRINDNGIIAFVTNNSFIDSKSYDGFRKVASENFNEIWIVDLKGDARTSGERRKKEGGNVFDDKIREGIAIFFLIKNSHVLNCNIYYNEIVDYQKSTEKRAYLREYTMQQLKFRHIQPDKSFNWINLVDNDFDNMIPVVGKSDSLCKFSSLGVSTNRNPWVYDLNRKNLIRKIKYFIKIYNESLRQNNAEITDEIKWSSTLTNIRRNSIPMKFSDNLIISSFFKPFVKVYYYSEKYLSDRLTSNHYKMFGETLNMQNKVICLNNNSRGFTALAVTKLFDLHFIGDTHSLPLYLYDKDVIPHQNIPDKIVSKLQVYYRDKSISALDIFNYIYGVLYNPNYKKKYELNLKREMPRIPLYENFRMWSNWGMILIELHTNYENAEPYDLKVQTRPDNIAPKPKLKANKRKNEIILDTHTIISGVPSSAWKYELGNNSALEWILDQYKERKPNDRVIARKFNTYKFTDYKNHVIDLIKRVTTVSVRTVEIMKEMEKEES